MRQSQLFTKTRKDVDSAEVSRNAQLLLRAGFVDKAMAGAYNYLPLGLRVLRKIMNIIREEMNAIGGQELLLTSLQDPKVWQTSGRWDDEVIDVWFRTALANGTELGLGNTHEEPITELMKSHVASYKDLPVYAYQLQTKFRNELRAKSGVLRAREFIMKDLYSFSRTQAEHEEFYEKSKQAYTNVFERVGIGNETFLTFASGGSFSQFSHEFQTVTDAGEDIIYLDRSKNIAINKEVYTAEVRTELGIDESSVEEIKAIEVGNIFTLGTRFSDALGLQYVDESGKQQPVFMGSYGIGPGRVLGTVVEVHNDDNGMIWPISVAPMQIHLLNLNKDSVQSDELYASLQGAGFEVLYDDRATGAGQKFADSDLIGIPLRVLVSPKTEGKVECKLRTDSEAVLLERDAVTNWINTYVQ